MKLLGCLVDRIGAAFVTEIAATDGTRMLFMLDPSYAYFASSMIVLIDETNQPSVERSGDHQSATWAANRDA